MYSISSLQGLALASRQGELALGRDGNLRAPGALAGIVRGFRGLLQRLRLIRPDPVRAERQQQAAELLAHAIGQRFAPADLDAAWSGGVQPDELRELLRGDELSGVLSRAHAAEGRRQADRRAAAMRYLRLAPGTEIPGLAPEAAAEVAKILSEGPPDRKARFAGVFRTVFEMCHESALREESTAAPLDARALGRIAADSARAALRNSETPEAFSAFEKRRGEHADALANYMNGVRVGSQPDNMALLQRALARAQHRFAVLALRPDEIKSVEPRHMARAPLLAPLRRCLALAAAERPGGAKELLESFAKSSHWAVPLAAANQAMLRARDQKEVAILNEVCGGQVVEEIVASLASDADYGDSFAAKPWITGLSGGWLRMEQDFKAAGMLGEMGIESGDFDAAVEEARTFAGGFAELSELDSYYADSPLEASAQQRTT